MIRNTLAQAKRIDRKSFGFTLSLVEESELFKSTAAVHKIIF